jgi:putative nucleotidyltransferase with HDIG domain
LQPPVSSFTDGRGSAALARSIRGARKKVREHMFAGNARPSTPTLLLDVLAESLIDRCAQAAADGNVAALLDWAAAICQPRADAPNVRTIFLAIGPALTQTFGERGFEALTEQLTPIVSRLRSSPASAAADTVNELDLLLTELISRVESNDPMTAEHCRAVSAWCARIAHRLSLTRSETAFVARGGLIHDVGKSITPHEILQAPRKLTESEWIVMREHVVTGHDIVRKHQHLRDFSPIVRSHHERFDGRGYPDGLERTSIPIGVRIVTVADAFNAMIGRRSYRTPLSPDLAMTELRRNAGSQLIPTS